jgi:oligopeptide/dipeptide ABC transporter ATP-binding protein
MMNTDVLRINHLKVSFPRAGEEPFHAVNDVSLTLKKGETLGIVGESGSGKTMMVLSMLGLIPYPGAITGGEVSLLGEAVSGQTEEVLQRRRGRDIGMIFQDPMTSLNPVRRVGSILIESLRRHNQISKSEARARALQAFQDVGIPSPQERLNAYPHELSGGLRQRVMIALAIINHPAVIVADEPTTALDATIQAQILELLRQRLSDAALMLITHDLGVAAELCDRIAVMYHGRIVETGNTVDILHHPSHPYSAGLLAAVPHFDFDRQSLVPIPGMPPAPGDKVTGCSFSNRCERSTGQCQTRPEPAQQADRMIACWHPLTSGTGHDE